MARRVAARRTTGGTQAVAGNVVALCGGVGGVKLVLGLYGVLEPGCLTVVANTGDDFEHLGLHVSPDIDTILYTLSGLSNIEQGWGRANETWAFMAALERLGGETWFRLGDSDLATHVERTRRLRAGEGLTAIIDNFASRFGIHARLLPMSDDPVRTIVHTVEGRLPFQHYFVKLACLPAVTGFSYEGAESAHANPAAIAALADRALRAVVLCPSNPYLSIDPILTLPGLRQALERCAAPVVAVSPIIGGRAVKGPTVKIMAELGIPADNRAVARHYQGLIDGLMIDQVDAKDAPRIGLPTRVTRTLMVSVEDRRTLAREVLDFAAELATGPRARSAGG